MKLTEYTLKYLTEFISGDSNYTPYLSGTQIISLFNSVGFNDKYDGGMPEFLSRNNYVFDRLKKCNESNKLNKILEIVFNSSHFLRDKTLDLELAINELNKIISTEGYNLFLSGDSYKIISKNNIYGRDSEVHFEEQQSKIKIELEKAEFVIWVAVAWFTDKELYDLLVKKRKDGLSIQVIVVDDEINKNSGLNLGKDFFVVKIPPKGAFENLMHHKFCVIDLKTVIHGSYNWTKKAQFNHETLDVETNKEIAEQFSREFIKLRQTNF